MTAQNIDKLLEQTRQSYEELDPDIFVKGLSSKMKEASDTIDGTIIANLNPQAKVVSMVDLGCASGLRTEAFIKKFRERYSDTSLKAYGVDFSEDAVKVASQRGIYERVVNNSFQDLRDLNGESFDIGICVGLTFQFLLDKMPIGIGEFARVLKTGGNLYMTIFYIDGSESKRITFSKYSGTPRTFDILGKKDFENMARAAGFKVEQLGNFPYNENGDPKQGYKILYKLTKIN